MGQCLGNQYTTGPGDYWQQITLVVSVDLCNEPLQHDTVDSGDILRYVLVHCTLIKSPSY